MLNKLATPARKYENNPSSVTVQVYNLSSYFDHIIHELHSQEADSVFRVYICNKKDASIG